MRKAYNNVNMVAICINSCYSYFYNFRLSSRGAAEAVSNIGRVLSDINLTSELEKIAEEVNSWWREEGHVDPYLAGTPIFEIKLMENTKFIRVIPEGGD